MSEGSGSRRGLPRRVKMRHDAHFVDDLTSRHEEAIGRSVPLSDLEPDPGQPRSSLGDLSELTASIRQKGVLEPLLVRPNPGAADSSEEARRYRIICGERRYLAAMDAGLLEVPVIELKVGEREALEITLVENLQRKDLTPFEEGEGFRRLVEEHGYTHQEIAEAVGKSRTVVTESLALLDMPPRAREAAVALDIGSKSLLLEIVRAADDEEEMVALLERVAQQGLGRDDLRHKSRRSKARSGGGRRQPYTFTFKAPDKTFNLSMSFRRSTVDREDLIAALEQILDQLKTTGKTP